MANEETGFGTIKCPGCGEAIPISEAIHHQIAERTRQEFKAEALEAKRLLAARECELNEKAAALDQTISERLAAERVNISKELEAKLRSGLSTEIADLKRQADERSERLAQAQAVELAAISSSAGKHRSRFAAFRFQPPCSRSSRAR